MKGLLFVAIVWIGCSIAVVQAKTRLPLMPYPAHAEVHDGVFKLSEVLLIDAANVPHTYQRTIASLLSSVGIAHRFTSTDTAGLTIKLETNPGENAYPALASNESYSLAVAASGITISASEVWGVLHGVQTLRQLYQPSVAGFNYVEINDSPRFPWRGLLIDSVRHFIPLDDIKRQLDGMASAKLNVFHWHLTDDQGWRIPIKGYPKLHETASDGQFYTHQQIRDLVAYAARLGIRVIPEVDFPGHASAIAVAYPELITLNKGYQMQRHWGVFEPLLDPSNPNVYTFIDSVFSQLTALFPDPYVHIGGDEVKPTQWLQSESVQAYMTKHGLSTPLALHTYFNHQLQILLKKHGKLMMGWDEILDPALDRDVMIQSWRGLHSLQGIVEGGFDGLLSNGFYIDQAQFADYHYRNDPHGTLEHSAPKDDAVLAVSGWKQFDAQIPRLKGNPVKVSIWLPKQEPDIAVLQFNQQPTRWARQVLQYTDHVEISIDTWMGPLTIRLAENDNRTVTGDVMIGNARYPFTVSGGAMQIDDTKAFKPVAYLAKDDQILGGEATLWSELVDQHNIDRTHLAAFICYCRAAVVACNTI